MEKYLSDVLNLDSIDVPNIKEKICMSVFPGRLGNGDFSYNTMESFFSYLKNYRYTILVSLIEDSEFDQFLPKERFLKQLNHRNFYWRHHPIKDMSSPDSECL